MRNVLVEIGRNIRLCFVQRKVQAEEKERELKETLTDPCESSKLARFLSFVPKHGQTELQCREYQNI